jgi:hypothetical protein
MTWKNVLGGVSARILLFHMEYKMELTKEMSELRQRNEERLKTAKEQLGEKWILHPVHQVPRKPVEFK